MFILNHTCQEQLRAGISWPTRSRQWLTAVCFISWGSFWGTSSPAHNPCYSQQHPGGNTEGRTQPLFAPAEDGGSPSLLQAKGMGQPSSPGEGRDAQNLTEVLMLSSIMNIQSLDCLLRFRAEIEVIRLPTLFACCLWTILISGAKLRNSYFWGFKYLIYEQCWTPHFHHLMKKV